MLGKAKTFERPPVPPRMRVTQRDRDVLNGLYHFRYMDSDQINALFFTSNDNPHPSGVPSRRRLQKLYHNGFIQRIIRPLIMGEGRDHFVYAIDDLGASEVERHYDVVVKRPVWKSTNAQVTPGFLEHTLDISRIWVAVHRLANMGQLELDQFYTEDFYKSTARSRKPDEKGLIPFQEGQQRKQYKEPDGCFVGRFKTGLEQEGLACFFEVDEYTEDVTKWASKVEAYLGYRRTNLVQKYYGVEKFKVLTFTTTQPRMRRLKEITEKAGGGIDFLFTTLGQIDIWNPASFLDNIWDASGLFRPQQIQALLQSAARKEWFSQVQWADGAQLKTLLGEDRADAYFTWQFKHQNTPRHFFLEIDRPSPETTVPAHVWRETVAFYRELRETGRSAQLLGTHNFRILIVCQNQERLNQLKIVTEQAGGSQYFWFTTQEKLERPGPEELLAEIWEVSTRSGLFALR